MYPLARHLMARSYLLAALVAGAVLGYTVSRVEFHYLRGRATASLAEAADRPASEPAETATSRTTAIEPAVNDQPTDDLELAARRMDERARRADRHGDTRLADFWRSEAARLRLEREKRDPTLPQLSAADAQ